MAAAAAFTCAATPMQPITQLGWAHDFQRLACYYLFEIGYIVKSFQCFNLRLANGSFLASETRI